MRYKNGIKRLRLELIEPLENHVMLISDFSEVYEMPKRLKCIVEKVRGYKAEFVIADESKRIRFNVEFPKLPDANDAEICH